MKGDKLVTTVTEEQMAAVRLIVEERSRLLMDELRALLGGEAIVLGMATGLVMSGRGDGEPAIIACMALGSGELCQDDGRVPASIMGSIYSDVGNVMMLTARQLCGAISDEALS